MSRLNEAQFAARRPAPTRRVNGFMEANGKVILQMLTFIPTPARQLGATNKFMIVTMSTGAQACRALIRRGYFFFSSVLGVGAGRSVSQSRSDDSTTSRW